MKRPLVGIPDQRPRPSPTLVVVTAMIPVRVTVMAVMLPMPVHMAVTPVVTPVGVPMMTAVVPVAVMTMAVPPSGLLDNTLT